MIQTLCCVYRVTLFPRKNVTLFYARYLCLRARPSARDDRVSCIQVTLNQCAYQDEISHELPLSFSVNQLTIVSFLYIRFPIVAHLAWSAGCSLLAECVPRARYLAYKSLLLTIKLLA